MNTASVNFLTIRDLYIPERNQLNRLWSPSLDENQTHQGVYYDVLVKKPDAY